MDLKSELNLENEEQKLSIENVNVDDIDPTDLVSVKKYAIFAGNAIADKMLQDPKYLNEHNDIVGLAFSNIAVIFDRIKNTKGIVGVSKENLSTMDYYELIMSSEAAIYGDDSRQGAFSLQHLVAGGNLPINGLEHIANLFKEANHLSYKILSDPNVEVDSGILSYIVGNTVPVIESLKRQ
jgi:hypothetical protein